MADRSLQSRLKRLFSTQVVVRRLGSGKTTVIDTQRLQSDGNRYSTKHTDRYGRLHSSRRHWETRNQSQFNYHASKLELYTDYEAMDKDSILHSVLDIYSDECTTKNDMGDTIRITSNDEDIKKVLYNLFYDILNIDFNLWAWIRSMNKYGDYYLYLDIEDGLGIVNVTPISAYEMERIEGYDEDNPYAVKFRWGRELLGKDVVLGGISGYANTNNKIGKDLEFYEVAHFRMMTDTNFLPYGCSLLEGARKTWKQLTLMEDAMMIHRIMRAPEKRIFKIDVGNIDPNDVDNHMNGIIDQMRKVPYVDQQTGDYNLKFNLMNMLEDYFLPVRGGQSGTEIDTLSGMEFGGIDDIEYLKNRMMAALKVPKAFIGYEENVEGKATLAQQDVRFARTVQRIQKIVLSELRKIAIIHLYSQGYENEDLTNFDLELTNPSIIFEQEMNELWSSKVSLANDLKDLKMVSHEWIYKNIFKFSDSEWKTEQSKVLNDLKLEYRKEQISSEGNDPLKTGMSFGTKHDLAQLGLINQSEVPVETPNDREGKKRKRGYFGDDPLGKERDINADKPNHKFRNSPLAYELTNNLMKSKSKEMLFESLKETEFEELDMLKESNIIDGDFDDI